jgi:hypothetical protein
MTIHGLEHSWQLLAALLIGALVLIGDWFAYSKGRQSGLDEGRQMGYEEGYREGLAKCRSQGQNSLPTGLYGSANELAHLPSLSTSLGASGRAK